jgi:hypothetical protein
MSGSDEAGSAMYPVLYEFLLAQGLGKTAKQLLQEASLGVKPPAADPDVLAVFQGVTSLAGKRKREGNGAAPAAKKAAPAAAPAADSDGAPPRTPIFLCRAPRVSRSVGCAC